MRGTLVICAHADSLAREAARRIADALAADAVHSDRLSVALAGGTTPRPVYELLAREPVRGQLPWTKLHVFLADERLVPLDHSASNYRMAWEALLRHAPVPRENLHPVRVQLAAEQAAQDYEQELRRFFRRKRGVPVFDLVLLGLGADGHTASLFPRAATLGERERLVVAATAPEGAHRITLTLPVLNQSRRVFFLVTGADKALALAQALEGRGELPAQRVVPRGELVWLADSAAASGLTQLRVQT